MDIAIPSSTKIHKKYDAVIDGKKKTGFGDSSYQDYTRHKNTDRKEAYIKIHSK